MTPAAAVHRLLAGRRTEPSVVEVRGSSLTCGCDCWLLGEITGLTQRQLDGFQLGIIPQAWIIYELWVQHIKHVRINEMKVIVIILDNVVINMI